jgi:elongation factor Ts
VKNPDLKVGDYLKETIAKTGENMVVRRFVRFELGEGIEKKQEDFAAEVAAQIKN